MYKDISRSSRASALPSKSLQDPLLEASLYRWCGVMDWVQYEGGNMAGGRSGLFDGNFSIDWVGDCILLTRTAESFCVIDEAFKSAH